MSSFGVSKEAAFQSQVQIDTGAKGLFARVQPAPGNVGAGESIVSDTGELMWAGDRGIVTINTPRSKAFIGKVTGDADPARRRDHRAAREQAKLGGHHSHRHGWSGSQIVRPDFDHRDR